METALTRYRTKHGEKDLFNALTSLEGSTDEYAAFEEIYNSGIKPQVARIDIAGDEFDVLQFKGRIGPKQQKYCRTFIAPANPEDNRMEVKELGDFYKLILNGGLDYSRQFRKELIADLKAKNPGKYAELRNKFGGLSDLADKRANLFYLSYLESELKLVRGEEISQENMLNEAADNVMQGCFDVFSSEYIDSPEAVTKIFTNIKERWEDRPQVYSTIEKAYTQLYGESDTLIEDLYEKMDKIATSKLETLEDKVEVIETAPKESLAKRIVGAINPRTWNWDKMKTTAKYTLEAAPMIIAATAGVYFSGVFGGIAKEVQKDLSRYLDIEPQDMDDIPEPLLEKGTRSGSEPIPICINESDQVNPAIYGDKIVWADERKGHWDIYMFDLATNKETRITNNYKDQINPAIYGDKIVWLDGRNGGEDNCDIYMYNLTNSLEKQITTNGSCWWQPRIYEDMIVWADGRNIGENDFNLDIYMYDLSTKKETQITTNKSGQYSPDIYKDVIVWKDYRNGNGDIYMYDLIAKKEIQITTDNHNQTDPAINGDKVVWEDDRNSNDDIYMYDLITKFEEQITFDSSYQQTPAIYGDKIVWKEYEGDYYYLYMYDLSTKEKTQLTTNGSYISNLQIYENKIVWSKSEYFSTPGDIYLLDLSGQTQPSEIGEWGKIDLEEICKLEAKPDEILEAYTTKKRMDSDIRVNISANQDSIAFVRAILHYDHGPIGLQEDKRVTFNKVGPGSYVYTVEDTTVSDLIEISAGKAFGILPSLIAKIGDNTANVTLKKLTIIDNDIYRDYHISAQELLNANPDIDPSHLEIDRAADILGKINLLDNCVQLVLHSPADIRVRNAQGGGITHSQEVLHGESSIGEIAIFPREYSWEIVGHGNGKCKLDYLEVIDGQVVNYPQYSFKIEDDQVFDLDGILSYKEQPDYGLLGLIGLGIGGTALTVWLVNKYRPRKEGVEEEESESSYMPFWELMDHPEGDFTSIESVDDDEEPIEELVNEEEPNIVEYMRERVKEE